MRGCFSEGWTFSSVEVVEEGAPVVRVEGESIVASVDWTGFGWFLVELV